MMKFALTLAAAGLISMTFAGAAQEPPPLPAPDAAGVATPTPATPLVPVPDGTVTPAISAEPIVLYSKVKYEDLDNVPRCAVPLVISIPDRCHPGCCRFIEICAPPDCQPKISTSPSGRKIEYDYGSFEVEIYNHKRYVVVNYDD